MFIVAFDTLSNPTADDDDDDDNNGGKRRKFSVSNVPMPVVTRHEYIVLGVRSNGEQVFLVWKKVHTIFSCKRLNNMFVDVVHGK